MNAILSPEAMHTFQQSLLIMAEGMTGIFVFMVIFYALIKLLNLITKPKAKTE